MPQVVFTSTVQLSDSGGGGEDVHVIKICQRLLALEKLSLQGPEGGLQGKGEHGRHQAGAATRMSWGSGR